MSSQEEEQTSAKNIARILGLSTCGLVTMPKYTLELSEIQKNKKGHAQKSIDLVQTLLYRPTVATVEIIWRVRSLT